MGAKNSFWLDFSLIPQIRNIHTTNLRNFDYLGSSSDHEGTVVRLLEMYEPVNRLGTDIFQAGTQPVISIGTVACAAQRNSLKNNERGRLKNV